MVAVCSASTIRTACTYVPECPSVNNDTYTVHVPYKDDCHKFYKCNKKCGYLMQCPLVENTTERLVFNPKLQVCDWLENVPEGTCSTTPTISTSSTTLSTPSTTLSTPSTTLSTPSTTTLAPSTTTLTSILDCTIPRKCSAGSSGKIIHEKDCRKYYNCRDGVKLSVPETCQEGHIFNPSIEECDETINSKCYKTDGCD
ncbi:hypothetical protein ANTQUA_LOCUS10231 [Anthophora quadrimaculata]